MADHSPSVPLASPPPVSLLESLKSFPSTHTLCLHSDTIMALALDVHPVTGVLMLYSGSQDTTIRVWNTETYECVQVLEGHTKAVLALTVANGILFSSAADNSIRLWDVVSLVCRRTVSNVVGDTFSLAVVDRMLYSGGQDTNIKGMDLLCDVERASVVVHEHRGYVYALAQARVGSVHMLFSGSGDGTVRAWDATNMSAMGELCGHDGSVLALAADSRAVVSGGRDRVAKVWDVETHYCMATLVGHEGDVECVALTSTVILTGSTDTRIRVWNRQSHMCVWMLREHTSPVLSLACRGDLVCSGGVDSDVRVWSLKGRVDTAGPDSPLPTVSDSGESTVEELLRQFVAIRSVSSNEARRPDCLRAAKFVKGLLEKLGAQVRLRGAPGKNPVVLARLGNDPTRKTVLHYGHYDVVPAPSEGDWHGGDPWTLVGRDGHYYGRGVSDNKGPILAFLLAVKQLKEGGGLPVNVVFVYEGEEECSSAGLRDAISNNMAWLGAPTVLLITNTYWLGDTRPCITYGMRGVVHMKLDVSGPRANLHSGWDGGMVKEPLVDLTTLLSRLVDSSGRVLVPHFYDDVLPVTDEERARLADTDFDVPQYRAKLGVALPADEDALPGELLMRRWRFPTMSFHSIDTSVVGAGVTSVIPRQASAVVSMRTVPNQKADKTIEHVRSFVENEFAAQHSTNKLSITVLHVGEWWIADTDTKYFRAAERAVEDVWKTKPLLIREGGTLPMTSYLQRTFDAPAIHIPLGQETDNAHLHNERIRLENLIKGKEVLRRYLEQVATLPADE